MRAKIVYFVFLVLLGAGSTFLIALNRNPANLGNDAINSQERDGQELIFLLQYIGKDYQNAVEDGSVISEFEYQEILGFSQRAIEAYLTFEPDLTENLALFELQQLRQMVFEKSDRYAIADLTKMLIEDLADELVIKTFPESAPEIKRGKVLYEEGGCGVCHGTSGAGDGPVAESLNPAPGSFLEEAAMNEVTPYLLFNAIRLGVMGTGMPSYEQAFSIKDSWDVAFYLMTLRSGFAPGSTGVHLDLTLEDLATKSNLDLVIEIQDKLPSFQDNHAAPETEIRAAVDFLRNNPELTN